MSIPTGRALADVRVLDAVLGLLIEHKATTAAQARSGAALPPDEAKDQADYGTRLEQFRDRLRPGVGG